MDVEEIIEVIGKYFRVEKCRGCECLQGLLVQLELDREELKRRLREFKVSPPEIHECLGCDPCPPAQLFTEYLLKK